MLNSPSKGQKLQVMGEIKENVISQPLALLCTIFPLLHFLRPTCIFFIRYRVYILLFPEECLPSLVLTNFHRSDDLFVGSKRGWQSPLVPRQISDAAWPFLLQRRPQYHILKIPCTPRMRPVSWPYPDALWRFSGRQDECFSIFELLLSIVTHHRTRTTIRGFARDSLSLMH